MDGANRIAIGIVAAAALLLFGFIGYREFERQRDIAEAQALMQGLAGYAQQVVDESRQAQARHQQDARERAEQAQRDLQARQLARNERCVSGTVVRITGTSYTQPTGTDGRPMACSGRYRLR